MTESIVVEITGKTYRGVRVGECLRLADLRGDKDGYPKGRRQGRDVRLHREVLGLTDPKVQALHHCDNPWCVEPSHLYAGSPAQNMADKVARGRARGNRLPDWKKNLYFELEQAYGPTLAAKCLGVSRTAVSNRRKSIPS